MQEKHTTSSVPLPSVFSFGNQPPVINSRDIYQHVFSQIRTLSQHEIKGINIDELMML